MLLQREDRQRLETHLHVARLEEELFEIVSEEFRKGRMKSSTLHPLRRTYQEKREFYRNLGPQI